MTDPQPYTGELLDVAIMAMEQGESPGAYALPYLAATLREFQRVLAENVALREQLRLATIAEATAEAEANDLRADKAKLGRFAGQLLAQLRDGCVPDGGETQDLLAEAGVIAPVQVTEPCKAEWCVCAEYGFPMACYRNTPLGDFCQNAARSGGEGNEND